MVWLDFSLDLMSLKTRPVIYISNGRLISPTLRSSAGAGIISQRFWMITRALLSPGGYVRR